MRKENKLTPLTVKSLSKPGLYGDGHGLYLQVATGGTKSWLLRYMIDGRPRKMGLGATHTVPLAEARKRAALARLQVHDREDPIDARKAGRVAIKIEAAKAMTFKDCALAYIAGHEAGWKNAKHRAQWSSSLEAYAYPVFGDLPVATVDVGLVVLRVLEPMWLTMNPTATRLRGRIETVLSWATVREYRTGDNPARWRGHLQNALAKRATPVVHHDAIAYVELADFMSMLRAKQGVSARALEFTILTAARTGETIGAEWTEIDLANKVWTVPSVRMKSGREHRVPLSDQAVAALEVLPRDGGPFVFPGARRGRPISNMAMLQLLRGMRGQGATVHGFRSTFRDWAAESTAHPSDVVEMALAHTVKNKVEAAYRRGDLFEKRRALMEEWSTFCDTTLIGSATVSLEAAQ